MATDLVNFSMQSAESTTEAREPPVKKVKKQKVIDTDGEKPKGKGGFTKQLQVSNEMSDWLGGPKSISRPELTSYFWKYVKGTLRWYNVCLAPTQYCRGVRNLRATSYCAAENELQDPSNKQFVLADDKLKHLTGETRFAAFGFMKFLNKHLL